MKYFAVSAFEYIRRQAERQGSSQKLLFMSPSFPSSVVMEVGERLFSYSSARTPATRLVIKVAQALVREWRESPVADDRGIASEVEEKGWLDANGNLTVYCNTTADDDRKTILFLVGVDRVTD